MGASNEDDTFSTAKMRIVASKLKSNPKQGDAKKDIVELLKNARTNRYLNVKKQPKIKPRYGIFGTSAWARVRRNPPPLPIDDIAQSQAAAKPIKERVWARIDDNLDFLLENKSEKSSERCRPAESYINLATNTRKAEAHNLSQQTEHIEAEAFGNVDVFGSQANESQHLLFDDNEFPNSPSVIDVTTPMVQGLPKPTIFSEFNSTKVGNVFDQEPPAYFETPSEAFACEPIFTDNPIDFNGHLTFDVNGPALNDDATFDDYDQIEFSRHSPISNNMSGWSANQLVFDGTRGYSPDSDDSMKTHYTPSNQFGTPSVANHVTTPHQQPLSAHIIEHIKLKMNEKMLESIRRLNNCLFPPVCDDSYFGFCAEYGSELQPYDRQTVARNWSESIRSPQRTMTTAYSENHAPAATVQQIFETSFFRNNVVTIAQTCTTQRIIRLSTANTFEREFDFHQYEDFDFEF